MSGVLRSASVSANPSSSKLIEELLTFLFDGKAHPLMPAIEGWLVDSRRFTSFANTFRDKIRKKIRTMPDPERILDLRLELETAYLLLRERSLSVVYEPQLGGVRAPDFSVSFTTSLTFMVEVTRIRNSQRQEDGSGSMNQASAWSERIAETVCEKLGQLSHQRSNILVVGLEGVLPTYDELHAALVRLQQRAERNDTTLLGQNGFRDRADFFRQYQRLSEILVRGAQATTAEPVVAWVNPQAKYPLPGKVRTSLHRSLVA